ncbi:MAG TPA: universal stress protein [Thermoanaerobaculia bacterium]|nr:universal stress protein [Thermoanaerobaculia bacterium]
MFSRVLFATDLSPASDLALDCVAGWKDLGLSKVTVAHVHAIRYVGGAEGLEEKLRADHAPKLERQAQRLRDAGVHASWRLEFGVPYMDVERIAREEGAEVVVIGSHGSSWIKEVWLGSIADAILRHVQLPTMVIKINRLMGLPREQCREFCDSVFGKALIATDFSPDSAGAVAVARELARRSAGELRLVHVQEQSRIFPHLTSRLEEFNREDTRRLEALATELRAEGAREVTIEVVTDHVVPGILAAIEEWRPRLVVLGRFGRGRAGRRLIGSTSHDVARESPVPVLVVPKE